MRRTLACALVGILAVALAAPSSAAAKPSKVGLVSFAAATTASLTLVWPTAKKATSYEVFRSTRGNMSGAKRVGTTKSRTFVARGLATGKVYCFQVRGKRGKTVGVRSAHTCKPTIRIQGSASGPKYRVMTYNVCSSKCSSWTARRQAHAQRLIQSQRPDVLAMQEAENYIVDTPSGYTLACAKSAKRLYFRTERFDLAQSESQSGSPCSMAEPGDRTGYVEMSSGRYAVWAELVDKTSGRNVIFVDVHTTSGKSSTAALIRKREITTLLSEMATNNPGRLPVVYAGDFNSHKNRPYDYVASVFHNSGYYDAYDLAQKLSRPNYNSYNDFKTTPVRSYTWGDHVDHVWVDPKTTRILRWATVAKFSGGKYVAPIPSDHNALSIDVQVD